jgi:hypothetical protein
MSNIFDEEFKKAKATPKFTDAKGKLFFESASDDIKDSTTALQKYNDCDLKRLGDGAAQLEAAYTYLALSFAMMTNDDIHVKTITAPQMFHFAGHAFREIGQLNRAADAYWRAGVIVKPDEFSVRSLARAKSCYAEIGETGKSDDMHVLEWSARRQIPSQRFPARALLGFGALQVNMGLAQDVGSCLLVYFLACLQLVTNCFTDSVIYIAPKRGLRFSQPLTWQWSLRRPLALVISCPISGSHNWWSF